MSAVQLCTDTVYDKLVIHQQLRKRQTFPSGVCSLAGFASSHDLAKASVKALSCGMCLNLSGLDQSVSYEELLAKCSWFWREKNHSFGWNDQSHSFFSGFWVNIGDVQMVLSKRTAAGLVSRWPKQTLPPTPNIRLQIYHIIVVFVLDEQLSVNKFAKSTLKVICVVLSLQVTNS